jgi:hypothetical protein
MVQAEGIASTLYRGGLSVNCNSVFLAEVILRMRVFVFLLSTAAAALILST